MLLKALPLTRSSPRRSSVDALDKYPVLIETRLSGNPVVEVNPHTRHEVVARVQRLTMLNGSLIGRAERRDAEIRYLRRALDEAGGASCAADAVVTTRHPRIAELLVRFMIQRSRWRVLTVASALSRTKSVILRQAEVALLRRSVARAWRTTC